MSESKHTPGPWTTKLYDSQIIVRGPNDIQVLATSWHGSIRASYPLWAESIANAQLAAAAPDLYEALQNLLTGFDMGGIVACDPMFTVKLNGSFERARAALAKAQS